MSPSSPPAAGNIRSLDFDANHSVRSRESQRSLLDDDVDFMDEVATGIIERDRKRMRTEVLRIVSFTCAVLSCLCAGSITSYSLYANRFLTDLHYTQYRINIVSITAELGLYLLVPGWGYICDRFSPPPLSLLASLLFGSGYLLAAYSYRSGPPQDAGGDGWPFGVMVLAFFFIGAGTSCMYLSAVATCAKNFAESKYRGFMLAVPIAAFGLSGMWQSQVGAQLLAETHEDGSKGDLNVFRYFVFLAGLLFAVGIVGFLGLRIVDEESLIDHGVDQMERSGLLDESEFFRESRRASRARQIYGTVEPDGSETEDDEEAGEISLSESQVLRKQEEDERLKEKKVWLLNHATHAFLTDRTMWLLAAGFFLLTGPGEAYINNLGTIIPTLTPRKYFDVANPPAGHAATHVSIIALTSTIARLFTGSLSDLFAPPSNPEYPPSARFTLSRLALLLPSAGIQLLAFVVLGLPFLVLQTPSLFLLSSALLGTGYGASFSLVPIIISVVWGAENFATNWGIVAMMPAGGAAIWSIVYSVGYSKASGDSNECRGYNCFGAWTWGCVASTAIAIVLLSFAWRTWRRRAVAV
ncbi:putative transporter mch1 [Cyphellophora attinorum]|uniref:Probable transporter MCH1 n=1 Tax=Cyphellophora attinorum TaxID=1664694 RepID=A0A0N1NY27_9EURO|nr:putative transporter mch1 [Phialophora attinorum]KPI38257.1 putative transporter mch1 [Phialophora attinorum]